MRNQLVFIMDGVDLTRVHLAACFFGVLLCVFFMQTMAQARLKVPGDTATSSCLRRWGLTLLVLALCWAGIYSSAKGWEPWPPDVAIILVVDSMIGLNIWVARRTMRSGVFLANADLIPPPPVPAQPAIGFGPG